MTIKERQQSIIDNFNLFDSWTEKYIYLIDLGKNLKTFPEEKKNEIHEIKGCQSKVWFNAVFHNNTLKFYATSDAAIVSGLIGILLKVYNLSSPEEILKSNIDFMKKIGLEKHLSITRNNGLHVMIDYIYSKAEFYATVRK